ncbi:macro domain-containing protein [Novipirellula sp.]|uniref:macro domain-containing protein n=1 Tax=Novipirellula sp. TaxID=2795430 RepID=UPI00356B15EB
MQINIQVGDVLRVPADGLISTANPWLNLSGGVNGAILSAVGPTIQQELHSYLKRHGISAVPAGSVVQSNAGDLPFDYILHAVAIDPFYDSSIALVRQTVFAALDMAIKAGAKTISTPTLATGYGPLSIADFGTAVAPLLGEPRFDGLSLTIVVRTAEHQSELADAISAAQVQA